MGKLYSLLACALHTATQYSSLCEEALAVCPLHILFDVVELGGECRVEFMDT